MKGRNKGGPSKRDRVRDKVASKLARDPVADLREQIAPLASGQDTVVVGPFTGEVGFELLYWIPMLRWVVREFPELRQCPFDDNLRYRIARAIYGNSSFW